MLTKEKLKEAKRQVEKVETPGWGEGAFVYVVKLSGTLLDRVQELTEKHNEEGDPKTNGKRSDIRFLGEMCVALTSDADGKPWLTSDDVPTLLDQDWVTLEQCVEAGLAFNNMTDDSMDEVKEKLKKNQRDKHG